MKAIIVIVCIVAILWRSFVVGDIIYDLIKTRVPSPVLNVILADSILIIIMAFALLLKIA